MSTLICFGFGYSRGTFRRRFGESFERIIGTVRGAERAAVLNALRCRPLASSGVRRHGGDARSETAPSPRPRTALVSVPPDENGDPVLAAFGAALSRAKTIARRSSICRPSAFMAITAVHGSTRKRRREPDSARSRRAARRRAGLADASGSAAASAVAVLRLAGIYGPGQNALVQIARGNARRIVKAGQVFNRIHVDDIAQAIDAAFARTASGIFNVADDEPSPPGDPLVFAARLLGVAPPPEIPFARSGAVDVADGFELLAGMPARAQRQTQTRARRDLALSDLSRRAEGVV